MLNTLVEKFMNDFQLINMIIKNKLTPQEIWF